MQQPNSKISRQRGVILTAIGYQKLHRAKLNQEVEQDNRCTLDSLSKKTGLTANTLSKIFSRSVPVDKRSLHACFSAFNLDLDGQDYLSVLPLPAKTVNFHGGVKKNYSRSNNG
jgi:transcriptional regulator with XRE-family HTH domain